MSRARGRVGWGPAMLIPVLAAAVTVAVAHAPTATGSPQAATQAANRAAVIVHTGSTSAAVCVRFDEPSLSGVAALQRAGFGAAIRTFSGQGSAVCGINGTGCSADASCLTCQAPSYWAYHRASPGAGGFTSSSVGAGATQVTDGSVEGWQWGTGGPPPFRSVDDVCGRQPAPPPAGGSGGGGRGSSAAAPPSGGGGGAPTGASTAAPAVTTTTAGGTTSTTARSEQDGREDPADAPPTSAEDDLVAAAATTPVEDAGSPIGVIVLGSAIAALVGGAWWIRRSRA